MNDKKNLIRLCAVHNLIFFVVLFLLSCANNPEETITIIWENEKAVSLKIPFKSSDEVNSSQIKVRLAQEGNLVPILGELNEKDAYIIFSPLIPFTRGQRYQVVVDEQIIGEVSIPLLNSSDAGISLLEIYPTQDTVPENLLKLFLKFSKPMREGESLSYLTLIRGKSDTLSGVFLELQPELWNEDQTMLTIWLDPGRIKRDLIPNLEMGAPLSNSESYKLIVSSQWKGLNGGLLDQDYTKGFMVSKRDSISPAPKDWLVNMPVSGSKSTLQINFNEALDYSLLNDVFLLLNNENEKFPGDWKIGFEEKSIQFIPVNEWEKGKYKIQIESRLEDLAGNNLYRLFETDLQIQTTEKENLDSQIIEFEVKE